MGRYDSVNSLFYIDKVLKSNKRYSQFSKVGCIKHVVGSNDTLDLLAYQYLGDSNLWWTIYDHNLDIITDFYDLPLGKTLLIPKREEVAKCL